MLSFEVWNLANGEDVEETKKQVEKYKKDNENLIRKNNFKLVSLTSFFHPPLISSTYSQSAARDPHYLPETYTLYLRPILLTRNSHYSPETRALFLSSGSRFIINLRLRPRLYGENLSRALRRVTLPAESTLVGVYMRKMLTILPEATALAHALIVSL